ncbi:MAG TPA: ATP-binding protein [Candidatus Polarisedimenticolaceae bacterium]|nr:ATP-binding protein [Candidatus Polarisedimenticolaceae bacterium]
MQRPPSAPPRRVVLYIVAVDALACLCLLGAAAYHDGTSWVGAFVLATLAALAGATPVRIPALKTSVSATDPFVFTAIAAYGPLAACLTAAAGILGSMLGRDSRRTHHLAFNVGNVVVSVAGAAAIFLAVGGRTGGPLGPRLAPLALATTVYFLLNTWLVTGVIVVDTGRRFLEIWRESRLWTAISAYGGLTLAAALLWALEWGGPSGLALGIPPCWLLAAFYRTHKERHEEQQARIRRVEGQNVELEAKVAERTQELQAAMVDLESANTRLRTTNERLVEANRAKSEFLANVSHELRTPLNAVIGFSDLLRDPSFGQLTPQQGDYVRDIHESGEHLLRLINEILDLSKIEAGRMEVHAERFEVARAIHDAVAMVRPQAVKQGLELQVQCAEDAAAAELDPGMFRQVLINLLSNAVKFTPAGGRVAVRTRRSGDELVVTVEDSGIGIAPEHHERIFEEFYQVDGSYARTYGGTGLGLALVRRMVQMQGGEIRVDSVPGEGSRFICRYPDAVVDALPQPEPPAPSIGASPDGAGRSILVVEDNPLNRKLVRNVLQARGYRVLEAQTGEEALRQLRGGLPDLVLMDLQLPGMDGLEVTRRLKADPATRSVPIVALTAHARTGDEERAREAGCAGYITKPIRLAIFPAQVDEFLLSAERVG